MPISEAAILGANALGGLFSGLSGASAAKAGVKEQKRQFNISNAAGPTRALESLPLRDRLMHILLSRFGEHPTTYTDAQASYTPGSGGTGTSGDIYKEMLRRMGYGGVAGVGAGAPYHSPINIFNQGQQAAQAGQAGPNPINAILARLQQQPGGGAPGAGGPTDLLARLGLRR